MDDLLNKLKTARDWEERYRLIIQAGKLTAQPTAQELAEMQPIHGCEARLWFQFIPKNDRTFSFRAFSEARIMNGLLWILLQRIEGKSASELSKFDLTAFFDELGIAQRLSRSKLNGLKQIEGILHHLCI